MAHRPDRLCRVCSTIDFAAYFNAAKDCCYDYRDLPTASHEAFKLGTLEEICSKAQECSFCWIVVQSICTRTVYKEISIEELLRKQRTREGGSVSCWIFSYCFARNHIWDEGNPHSAAFRIGISYRTTDSGTISTAKRDLVGQIQLIGEDALRIRGSQAFFGRQVDSRLQADLVSYWLDSCEENHADYCDGPARGQEKGIFSEPPQKLRVVDVKRDCITDLPASAPYMTLSYCWPTRETMKLLIANENALRLPGALRERQSLLPGVIRDAISLTRDVGETYLWVDALCIIQDDGDDKREQLEQMSRVYGASRMTIVPAISARDPEEACRGLPGYNLEMPSREQKVAIVKGLRLTVPFPCVLELVDDRTTRWGSRGWTYQECLLSRRILFLTEAQAYFQCRCSVFCEDTLGVYNTLQTSITPFTNLYNCGAPYAYQPYMAAGSLHLTPHRFSNEREAIQEYLTIVQLYSSRKLSFMSDALNAFNGLQHVLEYCLDSKFWYGLPERFFDSALLFSIQNNPRRTEELNSIHPRNLNFPSWCWAGWNCYVDTGYFLQPWRGIKREVVWYLISGHASIELKPAALTGEKSFPGPHNKEVRLGVVPSGKLPPGVSEAEFRSKHAGQTSITCYLACWTMVATLNVCIDFTPFEKMMEERPYHFIMDRNGTRVGCVNPRGPLTAELETPSIHGQSRAFTFMLMSRSAAVFNTGAEQSIPVVFDQSQFPERDWCYLNVMMIRLENDVAEQCGIGVVHEDAWLQADIQHQFIKIR